MFLLDRPSREFSSKFEHQLELNHLHAYFLRTQILYISFIFFFKTLCFSILCKIVGEIMGKERKDKKQSIER